MTGDLTVGNPGTVLWRFCLPLFGSVIFQQMYNIADSLIAGKFIGETALAAVGNAYEVTLLFLAVSFGCNIGCSVITAQKFGARQYGEMKTAVYTSLIGSGVLCVLLMSVGFLGLDWMLKLIQIPGNVFADCKDYLQIYILSLPFVFGYNVATGIFSALGDSQTPFWFLAGSSLTNIGMDMLFVAVFSLGVPGVAWAGLKMVWLLSVPLSVLFFVFGEGLVGLFLDSEAAEAVQTGVAFLHTVAPFYMIAATKFISDGVLRGAGIMGRFMISTFSALLLRVLLAYIFSALYGSNGIWLAWPIGWGLGTVLSGTFVLTILYTESIL